MSFKIDAKTIATVEYVLGKVIQFEPALEAAVGGLIAAIKGKDMTAEQKAAIDAAYEAAYQKLQDDLKPTA